jgi:hypothetical protein
MRPLLQHTPTTIRSALAVCESALFAFLQPALSFNDFQNVNFKKASESNEVTDHQFNLSIRAMV